MDKVIKKIEGVGEVGLDTEASPGNGQFYAKTYDGELDQCGYDTVEEAWEELCLIALGDVDAVMDEEQLTGLVVYWLPLPLVVV